MKPGDLICVKDKLTSVRIYTNSECNSWDNKTSTHIVKACETLQSHNKDICLFINESQNNFNQDILMVLFSYGIRWVYKMDFNIIQ